MFSSSLKAALISVALSALAVAAIPALELKVSGQCLPELEAATN
jgi:hypothetical protein